MMVLNEAQIRQIVMEEWFSILDEAGERRIVRPGGAGPTAAPTGSRGTTQNFTRPPIREIGDIVASRLKLTPDSPFVAGTPAFDAVYNMGSAEELIRFSVKGKPQHPGDDPESRRMQRLVSHVHNAGSYFIVPELFEAGKYGVGQIIDIVNRPVEGAPALHAPLALVEFPAGQHKTHGSFQEGNAARISNVGIAFLKKISRNQAEDEMLLFKRKAQGPKPSGGGVGGMRTVKYGAPR